ncbi:MAG TPA: hypothetical protein VHQ03_09015, partial [Candidatus Dormibacteraeota bacterium]|nr:hypothetical protein [Candidatus Dormibacteraeota bacterium]
MELAAGLYLVACVLAGFWLSYFSGLRLNLEERLVFGTVIGVVAVAVASFLPALLIRDVTLLTTMFGLAVGLGAAGAAAVIARHQLRLDLADGRKRWLALPKTAGHPWPLLAVFAVCGVWTVHFFHQAYVFTPTGLYAGYVNIWGDWAAHLSFAGSFAYGHNFPPQFPIDPGNHLGYP